MTGINLKAHYLFALLILKPLCMLLCTSECSRASSECIVQALPVDPVLLATKIKGNILH